MIPGDDPLAQRLTEAIRAGDLAGLAELLAAHPALAGERFGDECASRTALHLATDWPGNFPAVARTIALLVAAGAPVNGRFGGRHEETPLHWAASCDDVTALDALVAAGADLEALGAVLTGGTPLSDAVVFAQWKAARRLVALGATMTVWQAAALGDTAEMERLLDAAPHSRDELTNAVWHACRAGRVGAAQSLVGRGADLDRLVHDELTSRQAGLASGDAEMIAWLGTV
jgi:ankyrin repeat protein